MSQTPILKKRKTNSDRNLLIEGAKLGVFGVFWGSLLFVCLHQVAQIAPGILRGEELFPSEGLADYATAMVAYLGIGFLITFFVSVIPAALAGISNAWILISLARTKKLSIRASRATGIIIGCFFCLVPVSIGLQFFEMLSFSIPSDEEVVRGMVTVGVIGVLTAAIVGSWHSLQMRRYLAESI